ncbi:Structural maintenance of chromosomes protein 2 [Savitreella phatthalungensis]
MRIDSLVIDGFKSYAVRTEVKFDPTFTAITGLNGSGKSNILDAICFVLGITNMTTLRAQNLQDLIYKRGQAGVTKASVTIVFANDDPKTAPVGFLSSDFPIISVTRQIVMGGTSKYLINGHRAQQQTVQNLFQSVQLNINNPNFLIMQGRITKVLNMKPMETLSMIEEAAGTRMFEDKKDKAIRNIAKKEAKVLEINALLKEEIEPKLEKLRNEKRDFLEFQQVQSEVERGTKLIVAHDYTKLTAKLERSGAELDEKKQRVEDLIAAQARMDKEMQYIDNDLKETTERRDREMRKGGAFAKLEKQAKEVSHEIVRLATNLELKQGSLKEDMAARDAAQQSVHDITATLQRQQAEFAALQTKFDKLKGEHEAKTTEYNRKEELLQSLATGFSTRDGQESGYAEVLNEARKRMTAATTQQEQAKLKIAHYEKKLKEDEPRVKKALAQNKSLQKGLEQARLAAAKLEGELSGMGIDTTQTKNSTARRDELRWQVRDLSEQAEGLRRKVANLDFTYTDPTPNFDRSQVKGVVAQLFTLDEKHFGAATALEICAGGRLYNVVVDNERVGSQLLSGGKLRKRVTIIPLNKISAFKATADRIGAAQKLAPGKVDLALSLVGYDDEVAKAMEYVFGSTLVCADAETAKRVTFAADVRLKSVTLEGDVYDPSGTLSGGSKPQSSGVLVTLQKLSGVKSQLEAARTELSQIDATLAQDKARASKAQDLQQRLDLANHEIKLNEDRIANNADSRIIKGVEEMKADLVLQREAIATAKLAFDDAKRDVAQAERDEAEFKNNKDGKLIALQKDVDKLKKALAPLQQAFRQAQQSYNAAQMDVEQLGGDLSVAREQLEEATQTLDAAQAELLSTREQHGHLVSQQADLDAQLADERAKMSGFEAEIKSLEETRGKKQQAKADAALDVQQLRHEIETFSKELATARATLQQLHKDNADWLDDDAVRADFGKPGSIYDWSRTDVGQARMQLKKLQERFGQMKRRVNAKVMSMIDGVEKKEAALRTMVRTIHRDKDKIQETIISLDTYKVEALEKTWRTVTTDFGNIFNSLLPGGNTAKLEPQEGKPLSEGLEVRVCLGGVWKASLTELSGGQRSLIALSLIMSLLQYKPAPVYILDEVDAALDLSHTQNIGATIKQRFAAAQFIVVSLKEGMFTNANRLLRTKFVDNTSVVYAS